MKNNWLRWPVFLAGILLFLFFSVVFDELSFLQINSWGTKGVRMVLGNWKSIDVSQLKLIESIIFGFLPAVIACFAALFNIFWWELPLGVWFLHYGFLYLQQNVGILILVVVLGGLMLPALILCFAPFAKLALQREENYYSAEKSSAEGGKEAVLSGSYQRTNKYETENNSHQEGRIIL